jgi:hypothetical protein
MRLPACAPLRIAAGDVPSITVRETFEMAAKSVARTEATAALAVTSAVSVVARAVLMAVKTLRSAVIAVITAVASAVIVAKSAVKIVLAKGPKATVPVAEPMATAPKPAEKRAAIVGNVERVAANEAMMGTAAATFGVEVRPVSRRHRSLHTAQITCEARSTAPGEAP